MSRFHGNASGFAGPAIQSECVFFFDHIEKVMRYCDLQQNVTRPHGGVDAIPQYKYAPDARFAGDPKGGLRRRTT
jgi:hypothetical protein